MKVGGPNKVDIDRQMIREARLASNRYKMALQEKKAPTRSGKATIAKKKVRDRSFEHQTKYCTYDC